MNRAPPLTPEATPNTERSDVPRLRNASVHAMTLVDRVGITVVGCVSIEGGPSFLPVAERQLVQGRFGLRPGTNLTKRKHHHHHHRHHHHRHCCKNRYQIVHTSASVTLSQTRSLFSKKCRLREREEEREYEGKKISKTLCSEGAKR